MPELRPGGGAGLNLFNFHHGQFLAVADGFMIPFAALHLEGYFLLAANMADHIRFDRGIGYGRRAHGHLPVIVDEEDTAERDGLARLGFESPEAPLKAPGKIEVVEPLPEAIEAARRSAGEHGIVVVTGSLSTAGEARTLLVGPVE